MKDKEYIRLHLVLIKLYPDLQYIFALLSWLDVLGIGFDGFEALGGHHLRTIAWTPTQLLLFNCPYREN